MKNNDDVIDSIRYYVSRFPVTGLGIVSPNDSKLPKKVIINKNATVLIWNDDQKTIVKLSKEDKFDKEKGFLWAYFLKTTGMSRNQANKYLASLEVEK